ncbi:hypothetical protein, partial [Chitinophaga sp.]|uniref:hypothetical protein n=1 Tax=Chitinophaga sp. TaxID=1869181 RepID=UPI002C3D58AF
MKLIACFILVATFQVNATTMAQTVTIRGVNMSLPAIFEKIKTQTGYAFVYQDDLLKKAVPVTINEVNKPLEEILVEVFKSQPFIY